MTVKNDKLLSSSVISEIARRVGADSVIERYIKEGFLYVKYLKNGNIRLYRTALNGHIVE